MEADLETDLLAAINDVLGRWRDRNGLECTISIAIEVDQGSTFVAVGPHDETEPDARPVVTLH